MVKTYGSEPLLNYDQRCFTRNNSSLNHIWDLLDEVKDPEIPVISIWELGILQDIHETSDQRLEIVITPTYSGCPAMDAITEDIAAVLENSDIKNYYIKLQLAPAWTTDWMAPQAKKKLQQYGIAPPIGMACERCPLSSTDAPVKCPRCAADDTRLISQFGSTACKALYQCQQCHEPFDYFKTL